MALQASALYLDNDLDLLLSGLQKADTGAYLDASAIVVYSIGTLDGDPIDVGSFTYVASSSGDFRAKVEAADLTALVEGQRYRVSATAEQDGYNGEWSIIVPARRRGRN